MSFILPKSKQLHAKTTAASSWQNSNPHSRSSFQSTATTRHGFGARRPMVHGGGGQAQLMMQRQENKETEQQQQQQTQGVISMAEVMKDLRILEEQQRESQRQLAQVRQLKQQRLAAVSDLESSLQQIKYSNGQDRARMQRMHDLLATGQRRLQSAKGHADNARRDLEQLDKQLQQGLETKRAVLARERRQQQHLQSVKHQFHLIVRLRQEAKQQVVDVQEKSNRIKQREATLQRALQEETAQIQTIQQETVKVRANSSMLEQQVAYVQKEQATKLQLIESLKKQIDNNDKRHNEKVASLDDQLATHQQFHDEMRGKLQDKESQAIKVKEELSLLWNCVVEIQKAEGHAPIPPSLSPSGTTTNQSHPVLELDRIRESVQVEAKAASDEAAAKSKLKEQVDSMCQELSTCKLELEEKDQLEKDLRKSNEVALTIEEERTATFTAFFAEIKTKRTQCEKVHAEIAQLQQSRDAKMARAKAESKVANAKLQSAQEALAQAKQKTKDTETQWMQVQAERQNVFEATGLEMEELKDKMKEAQLTFEQLEQEKERVKNKRGLDIAVTMIPFKYDLSVEDMQVEIDKLVSEYPALEGVDYEFDPKKTADEQANEALLALRKDCGKRLDSAKKMKDELLKAKKLEQAERRRVEKAAADDEKRKTEARERRKQRLEKETSVTEDAEKVDTVEEERRLRKQRRKEKKREAGQKAANAAIDKAKKEALSAVKPRDMLNIFSQASGEGSLDEPHSKEKQVHWGGDGDIQAGTFSEPTRIAQKPRKSSTVLDATNPRAGHGHVGETKVGKTSHRSHSSKESSRRKSEVGKSSRSSKGEAVGESRAKGSAGKSSKVERPGKSDDKVEKPTPSSKKAAAQPGNLLVSFSQDDAEDDGMSSLNLSPALNLLEKKVHWGDDGGERTSATLSKQTAATKQQSGVSRKPPTAVDSKSHRTSSSTAAGKKAEKTSTNKDHRSRSSSTGSSHRNNTDDRKSSRATKEHRESDRLVGKPTSTSGSHAEKTKHRSHSATDPSKNSRSTKEHRESDRLVGEPTGTSGWHAEKTKHRSHSANEKREKPLELKLVLNDPSKSSRASTKEQRESDRLGGKPTGTCGSHAEKTKHRSHSATEKRENDPELKSVLKEPGKKKRTSSSLDAHAAGKEEPKAKKSRQHTSHPYLRQLNEQPKSLATMNTEAAPKDPSKKSHSHSSGATKREHEASRVAPLAKKPKTQDANAHREDKKHRSQSTLETHASVGAKSKTKDNPKEKSHSKGEKRKPAATEPNKPKPPQRKPTKSTSSSKKPAQTSGQTSGIPSMEGAPKARRRKVNRTATSSKRQPQLFGEDGFNFLTRTS